jgi:hypothetical protein
VPLDLLFLTSSSHFSKLSNHDTKFQKVKLKKMAPLATVGILSIGDMGVGIAKLLIAKNYRVVTNLEGRRYGISIIVASNCGLLLWKLQLLSSD